jgi:nucleoside-diphosphate-sugar epimerase
MKDPDLSCAYFESAAAAVFGFNGFIGRKLQLELGNFEILQPCDLPKVNSILHMATRPNITFDELVDQFTLDQSIMRLAESRGSKLIYTSSNNVYGNGVCSLQDKLSPVDAYGVSKSTTEILYSTFYSQNTSILRIADVVGRGQKHGNFFRNLELRSNVPEALKIFGSGIKTRNIIWIDDLIRLLSKSLRTPNFLTKMTYNIGYVEPVSIKQIAEYYDEYFGVESFNDLDLEEDGSKRIMLIDDYLGILNKPVKNALWEYFRSLEKND